MLIEINAPDLQGGAAGFYCTLNHVAFVGVHPYSYWLNNKTLVSFRVDFKQDINRTALKNNYLKMLWAVVLISTLDKKN